MKVNRLFSISLVLPALMIILFTVIYPVVLTFSYSLYRYKLTKPQDKKFIGLKNYVDVLKDIDFYSAMINTLVVVGVVLITGIIFSFLVALILNRENKFTKFLMAIAIIPWALPPVVNGLMWKLIFYPEFGLINKVLYCFGIVENPILWLNTRYGALVIFGIIVVWRAVPFCSIVLLTAMKSIPKEVFEASQVDGASELQQLREIVIPILSSTFIVISINLILTGISVFDEVITLVGFRKLGETFMIYNYGQTFEFLNIGYGSSISYLLTIIFGICSLIMLRVKKDRGRR